MVSAGRWIAKHRILIFTVSLLLLIPSVFGMIRTRVNYDLLTYLPESLDTVEGQRIMVDEFGMGAFSMIIVEDMEMKEVAELEKKLEAIPHVKDVLWYDDIADITLPVEMIPEKLSGAFFNGRATMLLALLDTSTSSDEALAAVTDISSAVSKKCFVSGMTSVINDVKNLSDREVPVYVLIAVTLSLIVLQLLSDSFLIPLLYLAGIGIAILYNMGTNIILGETSYITKALAAVLQLGVTMDYSIFLMNSYEENLKNFPDDREEAMGQAIACTFRSIIGSSVTTIAGFIALCFMSFTLGVDMGIVMAKGVLIGVICCITVLPSLILICDGAIRKTKHRPLLTGLDRPSGFITRHYAVWAAVFLALLVPAWYGNRKTEIYYDMAGTLPETLPSRAANNKLEETFGMSGVYIVMTDDKLPAKTRAQMLEEIEGTDGVKWAIGLASLVDPTIPESMIPREITDMLRGGGRELMFVCSEYKTASDEANAQVAKVTDIVKRYDSSAIVVGEAPLTKDLIDVTSVDVLNVNSASILAIFVIILLVFRSLSIPVFLVAIIEGGILINMGIPYYTGTSLPFVASIVVGTIQLGSTVDYAILMTSRYQKERQNGHDRKEAAAIAHRASMPSIITSGISFFAATFGVAMYTEVDMIGALCVLLSRGALISMAVVLFILPCVYLLFDGLICRTSLHFTGKGRKEKAVQQ